MATKLSTLRDQLRFTRLEMVRGDKRFSNLPMLDFIGKSGKVIFSVPTSNVSDADGNRFEDDL